MLMPNRVKEGRRKMHRGRMKGHATQGNRISFGEYAIVAQEPAWITSRQIEAARIAMTRHIKRGGQVWIRIFPDKSYTKKPLETRMGKGKAPVEGWVAVVKPGRVLFEMAGPAEDVAKEAMRLAIFKLPIRCKFMTKKELDVQQMIPVHSNGKAEATEVPAPVASAPVAAPVVEPAPEPTATVESEAPVEQSALEETPTTESTVEATETAEAETE